MAGDAPVGARAPAMQPAEIQFAQRLASHEKGIRDRAVKKLRQYISVKTQKETGGRPAVSRATWRPARRRAAGGALARTPAACFCVCAPWEPLPARSCLVLRWRDRGRQGLVCSKSHSE